MGSVPRREVEVVAPLASELSGAGQSRAESSRGVLLRCYFLLLFEWSLSRFQSPASGSRAGAPVAVESPSQPSPSSSAATLTSAARPLLGKKENLTLSRFALSSAHHQNDLYGQQDARAPNFFVIDRLSATRRAFHPMGFAPNRRGAAPKRSR